MTERTSYQSNRFRPGYWNGLCGGEYKGQYFNRESEERVAALMEVTSALREHGIAFEVMRWKNYYRVAITGKAYYEMSERLRRRILEINIKYDKNW